MANGRSIELFFHDGSPDGMTTATIPFQWTGHVLVTSRIQLSLALKESQTKNPGVYLLSGERDGENTLYIGETDEIGQRIRQHASTADKDWWDTAIFITAQGEPLNKAHARYLESQLYKRAAEVAKITLANGLAPTSSPLSKAAKAHMDDFFENLLFVLPALRFDFLTETSKPNENKETPTTLAEVVSLIFHIPKDNITAKARMEPSTGSFVVEKGSMSRSNWIGTIEQKSSYKKLFEKLVEDEILLPNDKHRKFSRDYVFKSSSAAAAVIAGRSATGPGSWKVEGTNTFLGEWEKSNLREGVDDSISIDQ